MTNRSVPADECLRLGLIDELHPADALLPAAQNLARRLAQGPGQALRAAKRLCAAAAHQHLPAHLACEQSELLACAQTADAAEGISAFLEKRAPRFPGASLHS
jgi:2-(1,2-epoxy-1,2-dihydrophenyl)acetyl-CoA isomerase